MGNKEVASAQELRRSLASGKSIAYSMKHARGSVQAHEQPSAQNPSHSHAARLEAEREHQASFCIGF